MRLIYKDGPKESTFEECSIFPIFFFGDGVEKNVHNNFFLMFFFPTTTRRISRDYYFYYQSEKTQGKKWGILQEDA